MTKLNFLNPIFVIIFICFFVTIIFTIMFLWPKFQKIEEIRENIIRKTQEEFPQKKDYLLETKELMVLLEESQEKLTKIASALPDDAELNLLSIFRFIQITSADAGLFLTEIGSFTISPIEEKPGIKKIQFSFQVKGFYHSFKIFLTKIEKSARIIKVENISFSSPDEEELFIFNLTISAHSY